MPNYYRIPGTNEARMQFMHSERQDCQHYSCNPPPCTHVSGQAGRPAPIALPTPSKTCYGCCVQQSPLSAYLHAHRWLALMRPDWTPILLLCRHTSIHAYRVSPLLPTGQGKHASPNINETLCNLQNSSCSALEGKIGNVRITIIADRLSSSCLSHLFPHKHLFT